MTASMSPRVFSTAGVTMAPGSTRLTWMPKGRSSRRSASVRLANALFDAQRAPPKGMVTWLPIEPMLTMRPTARWMSGRKVWVTAICPKTLTSNWCRRSSSVTNSTGDVLPMPALFTRPSSPARPSTAATMSKAASMVALLVTSIFTGTRPSPPSAWSSAAALLFRTPANTRKPWLTRSSAQARPIPLEAPVTTTDRCVELLMVASSLLERSALGHRGRRPGVLKPGQEGLTRRRIGTPWLSRSRALRSAG